MSRSNASDRALRWGDLKMGQDMAELKVWRSKADQKGDCHLPDLNAIKQAGDHAQRDALTILPDLPDLGSYPPGDRHLPDLNAIKQAGDHTQRDTLTLLPDLPDLG
ncbi:hypothetical protein NDU88_001954 [Pleurodeles waltl]|uniref:Uncharacterized protein n=1 Tax=Pleurodeles waltl TaxID=8319 RepID=A0AAV7KU04_PLEWA|nr:hypothetical protein NDU88_001954 [Pleurodeles waltl]